VSLRAHRPRPDRQDRHYRDRRDKGHEGRGKPEGDALLEHRIQYTDGIVVLVEQASE
jgi:hypothetical protein